MFKYQNIFKIIKHYFILSTELKHFFEISTRRIPNVQSKYLWIFGSLVAFATGKSGVGISDSVILSVRQHVEFLQVLKPPGRIRSCSNKLGIPTMYKFVTIAVIVLALGVSDESNRYQFVGMKKKIQYAVKRVETRLYNYQRKCDNPWPNFLFINSIYHNHYVSIPTYYCKRVIYVSPTYIYI